MSDVEWDADDFEPPPQKAPEPTDKWEGEDEDDALRDNWDEEDEEAQRENAGSPTSAPAKIKKKKLADRIAEKEAKRIEELERRRKEVDEKDKTLTTEEKLEEKLRIQKQQEDADLQLVNEYIGTNSTAGEDENKMLDEIDLSERDGLESFRKSLVSKIRSTDRLEKKPFFVAFVEDICRDLCQNLEVDEVKKVSAVLNSLYNEKVKASKPKNKKKGKDKSKLNVGQGAMIDDIGNDFGAEYDDFM